MAVIIDTIRESHSGEENDSTIMRNVVNALQAAVYPAALILIAHARKPSAEGSRDIMADNRGSGYVVGRMDTIIHFGKSTATIAGRALETTTIPLTRRSDGMWQQRAEVKPVGLEDSAVTLLADNPSLSIRQIAPILAEQVGISFEAARKRLQRAKGEEIE